jgi:catechol 2,3-dioxygenase-like lactoylglutathione lyase family enzyme
MQIKGLDHLVLTVTDIGRTCEFYEQVLDMEHVVFGEGRHAKVRTVCSPSHTLAVSLWFSGKFMPRELLPTPRITVPCLAPGEARMELDQAVQHGLPAHARGESAGRQPHPPAELGVFEQELDLRDKRLLVLGVCDEPGDPGPYALARSAGFAHDRR